MYKIIDSDKFGPNTEICSNFYEIWHSQQIEHACCEYNACQCLERLHGYRFRTWNYNTNYYSSYYDSIAQNDYRLWNSTHSQTMVNCFSTMLKVIKTWDQIVTSGAIKSKQKVYKLHRRIYDPFKCLWWNVFPKLPISDLNPQTK